jgi:class 3 adenylate cyclase
VAHSSTSATQRSRSAVPSSLVRDDLPTGTVTFLFTDVEGSTRLLEELGAEQYGEALNRHRSLIRASLAEYGGAEVDTQGDAFFCAFSSARAAVACAQDVQPLEFGRPSGHA